MLGINHFSNQKILFQSQLHH